MPKYKVYSLNALKVSYTPPNHYRYVRDLRFIPTNRYKPLWQAANIEEFKQAFIDYVECHYHAFQTEHVLHRYTTDNNLMIYQPGKTDQLEEENVANNGDNARATQASAPATELKSLGSEEPRARGVLNDFDMAVMLGPDGKPTTPSTGDHHITDTLPFMARHLIKTTEEREKYQAMYPAIPTYHLYRYDLESFFYILVWAGTRYDLKSGHRLPLPSESPLVDWSDTIHLKRAAQSKELGFRLMDDLESDIRSEWKGLWEEWIRPLFRLFEKGLRLSDQAMKREDGLEDFVTGGGLLTFENFMATIKVTPRKFYPKN